VLWSRHTSGQSSEPRTEKALSNPAADVVTLLLLQPVYALGLDTAAVLATVRGDGERPSW